MSLVLVADLPANSIVYHDGYWGVLGAYVPGRRRSFDRWDAPRTSLLPSELVMLNGGDTKPCVVCGREFDRLPGTSERRWSERRFCSSSCSARVRRRPETCPKGHRDFVIDGRGWRKCRTCDLERKRVA